MGLHNKNSEPNKVLNGVGVLRCLKGHVIPHKAIIWLTLGCVLYSFVLNLNRGQEKVTGVHCQLFLYTHFF